MKALALVAWSLLAACVESDHDRIANQVLAAHDRLHELLFAGTPEGTCGGEMLSGQEPGIDVFSVPPCTARGDELETRDLALELELPRPGDEPAGANTITTYDLVYLYGDESFRGTHFIFTEYSFFTISIDGHAGTDRHATLDGNLTVDGLEVNFSKESFVLP